MPWYGFERVWLTEDHRVGPYADYLRAHGLDPWADPHSFSYPQNVTVRSIYPEEHHQTTWVADRAIEFLQEHPAERPFFLWTSFVHPHHPFTPPAPYDTMYDPAQMPLPAWDEAEVAGWPERYRHTYFRDGDSYEAVGMYRITDAEWQRTKAFYYGMVSLIDKQVGRLMDVLRRRGLLENTLVVFTADHGEMLGDHHMVFKGTTYDCITPDASDRRAAGRGKPWGREGGIGQRGRCDAHDPGSRRGEPCRALCKGCRWRRPCETHRRLGATLY